ncbi:hypothetical protein Daesc_008957 [Daldinia eschscholtzii]|uniref:Uncharacterized protein n=1 Tax=Daldinia eschscholtzii TaxID=292717 RepID=A0AAX6M8Z6_9PEZI
MASNKDSSGPGRHNSSSRPPRRCSRSRSLNRGPPQDLERTLHIRGDLGWVKEIASSLAQTRNQDEEVNMSFEFVNRRGSSRRPRGDDNDEEGPGRGPTVIPPPYSPEFARRIQRDHRWQDWEYRFLGHPDREAATRKYEPRYHNHKLSGLAQALDQAGR